MLNALFLKRATVPGKYADGGGLYLEVRREGNRSWVFRYTHASKRREMGLGSFETVTLAEAREEAFRLRKLVSDGLDPIAERRAGEIRAKAEAARAKTFGECVAEYVKSHESGWSPKESADFQATLRNHASALTGMAISAISKDDIVGVLRAIWFTKTETARRVQSRIERVMGYAKIMNYRTGENPAAWRDSLKHVFPARSKIKPVKHYRALSSDEMPAFMASLRRLTGNPARALELKILTGTRSAEVLGARWSEFDLSANVWTIPGERMKAGNTHRIPLSPQARAVVDYQSSVRENDFLFAGNLRGRPLSEMSMIMLMRRMDAPATPHGFRSTFKDWAAEKTDFPNEVSEMALAHVIGDEVEASYRRGDLFEKRIALMRTWADFCFSIENSSVES